MIATSSNDCTIRIWDVSSRDCRRVLEGHSDSVRAVESVACSSDASLIASGSERLLKVLDAETGDVLHTIPTEMGIGLVRFLDRNTIMYADDEMFVIRDVAQSADVLTFRHNGMARAISSDGTRLVTHDHGIVKIWQTNIPAAQNQDMAGHHTGEVYSISFSRDGQLVASGSLDHTAKIWDTSTGQCITTFRGHLHMVYSVSFSPDSTVCGSWGIDRFIRIWDVQIGNQISTFRLTDQVYDMCFSPNGSQLACLSQWAGKLLEVATGNCLASMGVGDKFRKISFDVDGTSVILRGGTETQRFRLSSTPHESDTNNPSSLPMVFVPITGTDPTSPDLSSRYLYGHGGSWILDGQDRRMLWVPPDFRWTSNSCGKTVVLTTMSGIVAIVNFRV